MSEGMHSTEVRAGNRSRNRMLIAAAGTTVAVVAAVVSIQFFRARSGGAAEGDQPAAGVATLAGEASSVPSGQPLARVGRVNITRDMVAAEALRRYGDEVLEKLINRTIIEQACADRGVSISADEVQKEVVDIARKFNLDQKSWLQMLEAERGISPAEYSRDIIWPMLALKKLAGSEVTVAEEDMQKAFLRDYGPRVECKMIMCDNVRRAQEVWNKAAGNPEEFGRLAREHSIEPTSRALEGDVPPIRRYSGNDALEKAAFKLKPGEVSGIVEVGVPPAKRYVILQCKGQTRQVVKSIEDVREQLYSQLTEEKTQEAVARVFEQIKDEIRVDNYVKGTVTGGPSGTSSIQKTSGVGSAPPRSPVASPAANRTGARSPVTAPR